MTFEEKRAKLLWKLEFEFAELHKIVADPKWTNEEFRPYQDCLKNLLWSLKYLRQLNEAQQCPDGSN